MNRPKSSYLHTRISSLYKILISSLRSTSACNFFNFFNESATIKNCPKIISNNSKYHDISRKIGIIDMSSEWLTLSNRLLIFIVFPGISNPGPKPNSGTNLRHIENKDKNKNISVFYQNVQGLIPFSKLTNQHPCLDNNKIYELQAYIFSNSPDIIILNETWLKPTVLSSEILPCEYNVFRLDRSQYTHPIDPLNPKKFRRNGGGVLIAVHNELFIQSKIISLKCVAELLAVELTLCDGSKIILTTCYRVGTLGTTNCNEIIQTLSKLSRKKMLRKFVVIGDFNLKGINWVTGNSKNFLENEFVNGFSDLGLLQCIDVPTHNKGNILDILLTKSKQYIKDLKVIDTERYCISDHFAITFNISQTVIRKPRVKRTCYNYKNARWENLNSDLSNINWDVEFSYNEPENVWRKFKSILFEKIDVHVPKFTTMSEHQPPWFDSECYTKCKEKDKLHKNFKAKKTIESELKFKTARRDFKTLIKSKMRANLDMENRNILTKKFWSHVKSTTKSTRIPEVISYCGSTASEPLAKATLFNEFFHKQFSGPSTYDISIDFRNDDKSEIEFSVYRIKPILNSIDINKAQGPDAINGAVLKNCSATLAYPLSKMFHLIYNVGYIPSEWKLSNVVPIHKKDDKSSVENYRPISLTSLVMKVLERIMHEELLTRTETKIDPRQHGFLKNKSCNTNLLSFANSVSLSLHDKLGADVIYFDFSKAFDTVSHDIILNKLKTQYNIDGALLKFFANYLQGRRQRVVLENAESECVDVLSGIPQGSILGPLLFLLFINNICIGLNKDTNIGQYADDTKIWREINTESDCAVLQNGH